MPSSACSRRICATAAVWGSAAIPWGTHPRNTTTTNHAASQAAPRRPVLVLFKQCVEETVVITQRIVRDATGIHPALGEQMAWRRQQTGIGVVCKERLHLVRSF